MLFFHCGMPQNDCHVVQPLCPRQPVPVLCYSQSKKVFLDVQKDLAVFQFVPIVTEKKLNLLCTFPLVFLHTLIRSSKTFSRLNSPSSLSLLIWEMLQSFNHLCGPLLDSFHYVPSLFCCGGQNWTQQSSHGLICAEQRGKITGNHWQDLLPTPV